MHPMQSRKPMFYLLACGIFMVSANIVQSAPVHVIFDTDMDTDCDDAGALAIQWPGPIVFSGMGEDVLTGESLKDTPDTNPVKIAYRLYLGERPARPSWDLIAVLYAVRPNEPYWILQREGYNHIFENGTNEWRAENKANHSLLTVEPEKKGYIKALMNKLMANDGISP